jgi:SNF2 family DNA or RNA helicase
VKAFAEAVYDGGSARWHVALETKLESGEAFEDMKARCKAVPGARWHAKSKRWRYPLAVETCHELRKVWGDGLSVGTKLGAWYLDAAKARSVQAARASQGDADLSVLPEVAPALFATLRPDQRVGVAWVAAGYRGSGLLADQPGLGKTLEAIGGILEAGGGQVLIVCPKLSVKRVWQREWNKWAPDVPVYSARGTRARRQRMIDAFNNDPAKTKVLVVVAEMLRVKEEPDPTDYTKKKKIVVGFEYPELFRHWDWVAVDESHKLFGSLTIAKGNLMGKGMKALRKEISRGRRLAITGTPFGRGGRVQGMFGTLHWLWPDEYTSFWRWAEGLFEVEDEKVYIKGGRGATKTVKRIGKLRKGGKKDFFEALGPRVLRRTKKEVLKWLPPKQYVEVLCEMEGKQLAQYKTLSDEAEVVTDGGLIMANGVLAEITRAKQVANGTLFKTPHGDVVFSGESCKVDMLMQMLEQRGILDGDGDLKVIVASQFNEFLKVVQERLLEANVGYHIITGKTSDTQRDKAMEEFQSDGGHRVFLLNAKAGGVSVTLDAADEVHCLDELYNPEDQEQLEDRAHRASRNHQVTIYHYRTEGTIDEQIATNVEGKRQAQHAIMDGRRGIEYARDLIRYRKPADD